MAEQYVKYNVGLQGAGSKTKIKDFDISPVLSEGSNITLTTDENGITEISLNRNQMRIEIDTSSTNITIPYTNNIPEPKVYKYLDDEKKKSLRVYSTIADDGKGHLNVSWTKAINGYILYEQ